MGSQGSTPGKATPPIGSTQRTPPSGRVAFLSPKHQKTLQESWNQLQALPGGHEECIQRFYRTMLTTGGEHIRKMFAYTDMLKQQAMLASVVEWALGNNFTEDSARRIGVLHSHLGVSKGDMQIFARCFIETIEKISGSYWRPEYGVAWTDVFNKMMEIMLPAIEEADAAVEEVTRGTNTASMSSAHKRLTRWFRERIVPDGDEGVHFSPTSEEPAGLPTVQYACCRAPLRIYHETSTRIVELYGRLMYLNVPGGQLGNIIDFRSVTKVESDHDKDTYRIRLESGDGLLLHFILFSSETIFEKWLVIITKKVKQFSSFVAAPPVSDIDALTRSIFSEKQILEFTPSDFEYLTLLGRGSFGKVVKVQHKVTNRVYAMKIIQKTSFSTMRNVVEVRREKAILETVDSPFIVKFFGFFQSDDRLYFLFDFLSGGELFYHTKCAPNHHFDENTCRYYCAEIACALEHLRLRNIVHRDIKGDNFVLDGDGHVVLTDFGFAKAVDKEKRNTATCGTLAYIAPEVLAPGPDGYGYEVDWWSLGVVMFTMLTGFFPFLRPTPPETAKAIVYEPLRFPSTVPTTHNARSLCRCLMHKSPKQRIASLADLQAHPFFAGFDWDRLMTRQLPPPFVPDTSGANTKYFNAKFTQLNTTDISASGEHDEGEASHGIAREKNVFSSFFFQHEALASEAVLNKVNGRAAPLSDDEGQQPSNGAKRH